MDEFMDEEALERSRHGPRAHVMDRMDEEARPRKKPPAWAPPVRTPPRKALTVWCAAFRMSGPWLRFGGLCG